MQQAADTGCSMNTSQTLSWTCKDFDALSLKELYAILAMRQEIFVVEQNCPYLDTDGLDALAQHVLGTSAQGTLMAYARFFQAGVGDHEQASIGRVVVTEQVRGQGIGERLMREAITLLEDRFGRQPIEVAAQVYLRAFYRKLGFQQIGDIYLWDGIPHIDMVRQP